MTRKPEAVTIEPVDEETAGPCGLIGDKGEDPDHLRALLDSRGSIAVRLCILTALFYWRI